MPQRLARQNHGPAEALELVDRFRMAMDLIRAADGSHLELIAAANGDGHAITTGEHAAIVDDSVSDLLNVEAVVNAEVKRVELRLPVQTLTQPPLLLPGEKHGDELANRGQ